MKPNYTLQSKTCKIVNLPAVAIALRYVDDYVRPDENWDIVEQHTGVVAAYGFGKYLHYLDYECVVVDEA